MRTERDTMGEVELPEEALYGASTQRAVQNFSISSWRFSRRFIEALGTVKRAAAEANSQLSLLDGDKAKAIMAAADEVISGALDAHFVVDIFQTGSATSTNMNANEVIANRAIEILGGERGNKSVVHPNDDVNMCQSSNDVIPTTIHLAILLTLRDDLFPALQQIEDALGNKACAFESIVKAGRTHLQDAAPITMGQAFSGYAEQICQARRRIEQCQASLESLALGGTAVGTGLNAHPKFAPLAISIVNRISSLTCKEASNHFASQAGQDAVLEISSQLRGLAVALFKIVNDIRWLAAGPRCNLAEITLPEVQPGSSIMPGKVNPVICESALMVAVQVMANDTAVMLGAQHGNFELNTMLPLIAHNVLQSVELLAATLRNLSSRCIEGIGVNQERCQHYAEQSLAICTPLAREIGYDNAAKSRNTHARRG